MTSTITENEKELLIAIRDNEFHDGNHPVENWVWVDCIHGFADKKKFGGTMASICKKGLAKTDGECCTITQEGFELIHLEVRS